MSESISSDNNIKSSDHAHEALRLLGLEDRCCEKTAFPQIIRTVEAMEAIREDWEHLSVSSKEPLSQFQTYDWCINWAKHCYDETREELSITPIWKGGELVALLPLMITIEKTGVRVMRFLGEPIIEYSNVLINKQKVSAKEVVDVWKMVRDRFHVDAFVFKNFPQCSCLFDIFGAHTISRSPSHASSVMDLTRIESWEDYRAGLSRSARRSRNKRRNKLEKLGKISYRVYEGGSEEYKNIVARSVLMKQEWLTQTGRNVGDLFEESAIAAVADMKGSLKTMNGAIAGALCVDDKIVATEVGFLQNGTYLSYIGAFDWNMRRFSVGKIQIEEALKWSLNNRIKTYDFLGEPSVYKSDWSNDEVALYSCHYGASLKGWIYAVLWKKKLRPVVKKSFLALPVRVRRFIIATQSS